VTAFDARNRRVLFRVRSATTSEQQSTTAPGLPPTGRIFAEGKQWLCPGEETAPEARS
jgi:hypothetical protein